MQWDCAFNGNSGETKYILIPFYYHQLNIANMCAIFFFFTSSEEIFFYHYFIITSHFGC